MKHFLLTILVIFSLGFSAEPKTYGNVTVNRVVSVYDGDTITVDIDNYPPIIGQSISVRIYGIDTPEIRSKNPKETAMAYKVKAYVQDQIKQAKVIELKDMRKDKYFRILADVYLDGVSLGDLLINQGYAVKYDGGKKRNWAEIIK